MTGPLTGTQREFWFEPVLDGAVLHYFFMPSPPAPGRRTREDESGHDDAPAAVAGKRMAFEVKSVLEAIARWVWNPW